MSYFLFIEFDEKTNQEFLQILYYVIAHIAKIKQSEI
jgi:hypothetical protein